MNYAFVSDIHGNKAALDAVLKEIHDAGIDKEHTFCLGDVIGYGPYPKECLDLVRASCGTILAGNHEAAAARPGLMSEYVSHRHILQYQWTLSRLSAQDIHFLSRLPVQCITKDFVAAHAKPCVYPNDDDNCRDYIYRPQDGTTTPMMYSIMQYWEHQGQFRALFGHTHDCWILADGKYRTVSKNNTQKSCKYDKKTPLLCCVGSVGQPRDGDWRAAWTQLGDERIILHRVAYDVQSTRDAIKEFDVPVQGKQLPATPKEPNAESVDI